MAHLGPLSWRNAGQVTLAAFLAMLGGMALSPERWFWAVIAVYVVFLNTRSRGDTIHRGAHRMLGTLAGLFGGLAIAWVTGESGIAQVCILSQDLDID
ncbi:FUSC family protein [Roseomonas gilardii]|uniref:FUSC family protein n=1 Tax=Roseomonas gilardii TaxID=257708 RepID=UPI001C92F5D7|nr:FUSC family protein [Roseomonas gilardii]